VYNKLAGYMCVNATNAREILKMPREDMKEYLSVINVFEGFKRKQS
jgi:hypothetical protein